MKELKKRVRNNFANSVERYAACSSTEAQCSRECGGMTGNQAYAFGLVRDSHYRQLRDK